MTIGGRCVLDERDLDRDRRPDQDAGFTSLFYLTRMLRLACLIAFSLLLFFPQPASLQIVPRLKVSSDGHRFQTGAGQPFFWLGDTGWLLFKKTTREEAAHYLDVRRDQGFNVIQAMLLHELRVANAYGKAALIGNDVSRPEPDSDSNSYWNYVDFVIREAARRGMYMALVPVWGGPVKAGKVTVPQAEAYATFLAKRFGTHSNIIWLNGGDIRGSDGREVWETIGRTLRANDSTHLIGFHPRGRYSSSDWFHEASWLDFNMVQSGHRTYAQDTSTGEKHYGEDNWRYIGHDYALKPAKPVLDGEPSYENIPHGLHDSTAPRWTASDIRRYAWWSVLSGAAGFTYGENAVMQFHKKGDKDGAYGVNDVWTNAIHAPGARQLQHLTNLMHLKAFRNGKPRQSAILSRGSRYKHQVLLVGDGGALIYTPTRRPVRIDERRLGFGVASAAWINPATGEWRTATIGLSFDQPTFIPPARKGGRDWILALFPRDYSTCRGSVF